MFSVDPSEAHDREVFAAFGERLSTLIPEREQYSETHGERSSRLLRRTMAMLAQVDADPVARHRDYVGRVVHDVKMSAALAVGDDLRRAEAERFSALADVMFASE